MKLKFFSFITWLLFISVCNADNSLSDNNKISGYLKKPTGQYGVGFKDFHWINTNICPDPNYNGKNKDDFSPQNKRFCHEVMVRIYYPTTSQIESHSHYYKPIVKNMQNDLAQIPGVTQEHLFQLNQIKSFSAEKLPIVAGEKFPVIFFSPGFGSPIEMYENFTLELVSHGYVIVGINSSFISGDVELPNGHVVKFNSDESLHELIEITSYDLAYTYKKIRASGKLNPLFSVMDLQHIGGLGQSLGGEIIANAAHSHPNWFQVAATLDSGIDKLDDTLKKFAIPFMRQISANRKVESSIPIVFNLENEGFLVGISPSEQNHDFSYHMNFTDYSTLQYLPAEKIALAYSKQQKMKPILGTGNGWEITNSINIYLLQFFNTYLKGEINPAFDNCSILSKNTYIKCGPRME